MATLSNPLALITGATSGIGSAFVTALLDAGYDVIGVARRTDHLHPSAQPLAADLATGEGLHLVESRIAAEPRLDFLVNNAGFGSRGLFWEADAAQQDRMHRLHVLATMRLTRAALPRMVERDRGAIINVSSVAGFSPILGGISYSSTKAWMNNFTEGLDLELSSINSHVRVQALCPGFTRTGFHDAAKMDMSGVNESLWMTPDEVVSASLDGLARNELYVVPGWQYKAWVAIQKLLPRAAVRAISMNSQKKLHTPKHA